jgi:hypothetical protein
MSAGEKCSGVEPATRCPQYACHVFLFAPANRSELSTLLLSAARCDIRAHLMALGPQEHSTREGPLFAQLSQEPYQP